MWSKHFFQVLLFGACLLLASSSFKAQSTYEEKHIEVSLRMIGHQMLLNSGDSISRVLPIIREDNQYRIRFNTEFAFNPDELSHTVNQVFEETGIANGYVLEVKHCKTEEVVYSFEMGDLDNIDIVSCGSRSYPESCYSLVITLFDEQGDDWDDTLGYGGNIGNVSSINTLGSDESLLPSNTTNFRQKNYQVYILILLLLIVIMSSMVVARRKQAKTTQLNPNMIQMGKYLFDKINAILLIEQQQIVLTSKEADLLLLLFESANNTVKKELILNVVWEDNGDYVGRTLDVFISKLRKKLESDSSVRIMNVRGVGYKLVVAV